MHACVHVFSIKTNQFECMCLYACTCVCVCASLCVSYFRTLIYIHTKNVIYFCLMSSVLYSCVSESLESSMHSHTHTKGTALLWHVPPRVGTSLLFICFSTQYPHTHILCLTVLLHVLFHCWLPESHTHLILHNGIARSDREVQLQPV